MSFVWFNSVLTALGKRLNYDSLSNLYGNSFAKDASEIIHSLNPLIKVRKISMFDGMNVQIEEAISAIDELESEFADIEKMFSEQ